MDPTASQHHPRRASSSSVAIDAPASPHAAAPAAAAGPPLPPPSAAVFTDALTEAARPCHLYYVYEDDVRACERARDALVACGMLIHVSDLAPRWWGGVDRSWVGTVFSSALVISI